MVFTIDAAFFSTPKALIKGGGSLSVGPPMSKFIKDLGWISSDKHPAWTMERLPLRLRPPITIGGNFELPKGVALSAKGFLRLLGVRHVGDG